MNKERLCGIYRIRNKITRACYIGQSENIKTRFEKHKSTLKHNSHENPKLQNSYNKHKLENFEFAVLGFCPIGELDKFE